MTLHICRDLVSLHTDGPTISIYMQALFLYGVMGFTQIGNTNFNVTGSYQIAAGSSGSINLGTGLEYAFVANGHTAAATDINSILAIRSDAFPRQNSGLFRVTGFNTASNSLVLDYRSADFPPIETSLPWKLFTPETSASFITLSNNVGGYRGKGSSTNSRLILQSPVGWQVRLTYESDADIDSVSGSVGIESTIAPGFSGSSIGDFATRGSHLHVAAWHDAGSKTLANGDAAPGYYGTVGLGTGRGTGNIRFYMWGETSPSGSFVAFSRPTVSFTFNSIVAYGFCEDETQPSLDPLYRIFVFGKNVDNTGSDAAWSAGPVSDTSSGHNMVSYGFQHKPVFGAPAPYSYSNFSGGASAAWMIVSAGDCPFIGATELVPVELWAGTWVQMKQSNVNFPDLSTLEPRRLGIFPLARLGRANFGNYTSTNDPGKTWIHLVNGFYLPWSGSLIP